MKGSRILIVDDDAEVRALVSDVLSDEGYKTSEASNESEALYLVRTSDFDLVFLDLWIGEDESAGLKIFDKIRKIDVDLPVIIISGHGTIDVAVNAIQKGAFDFIEKPFVIDRLLLTVNRALELVALRKENFCLKADTVDTNVPMVGESHFAQTIRATMNKLAQTNSRVFIRTSTGLCADSVAYYIHKMSQRADFPFVYFNCLTGDNEESEARLFGTEKSEGCIERANFGTLFLDNISKLPMNLQKKLLQFLRENRLILGQRRSLGLDVRIICSCSDSDGDVLSLLDNDLFYRLSVSNIALVPLSCRREDILPLVDYYLRNANRFFGLQPKKFAQGSIDLLVAYDWPGNICQVKSVVESALVNALEKDVIDEESLPPDVSGATLQKFESFNVSKMISLPLKEAQNLFERDYLRIQVERFSGNISKTSEFVKMERSALHRKLRTLGITVDRSKYRMNQ
ncbi:MAG: sigma-54-dependent Fis family transcriptional regulator [Alphaproteobacteria bacterium]|nr:sigma-54-dependent Fis family transcriptional regulator [Alphaproteobacteria bacterium]